MSDLRAIPAKYAQPDPATLAKLPKPTKRDAPKGACKECGGWHGLPAIHLDYMGHADVTLALIDVDPEWTWSPAGTDPHTGGPLIQQLNGRLVMWANLTILGKTLLGVGTCEQGKGDPEKELIGDFLRNAAMRFGIGTRLWSKAEGADPFGVGDEKDEIAGRPALHRVPAPAGAAPPSAPAGEPRDTEREQVIATLLNRLKKLAEKAPDKAGQLKAEAERRGKKLGGAFLASDPAWMVWVDNFVSEREHDQSDIRDAESDAASGGYLPGDEDLSAGARLA